MLKILKLFLNENCIFKFSKKKEVSLFFDKKKPDKMSGVIDIIIEYKYRM